MSNKTSLDSLIAEREKRIKLYRKKSKKTYSLMEIASRIFRDEQIAKDKAINQQDYQRKMYVLLLIAERDLQVSGFDGRLRIDYVVSHDYCMDYKNLCADKIIVSKEGVEDIVIDVSELLLSDTSSHLGNT